MPKYIIHNKGSFNVYDTVLDSCDHDPMTVNGIERALAQIRPGDKAKMLRDSENIKMAKLTGTSEVDPSDSSNLSNLSDLVGRSGENLQKFIRENLCMESFKSAKALSEYLEIKEFSEPTQMFYSRLMDEYYEYSSDLMYEMELYDKSSEHPMCVNCYRPTFNHGDLDAEDFFYEHYNGCDEADLPDAVSEAFEVFNQTIDGIEKGFWLPANVRCDPFNKGNVTLK